MTADELSECHKKSFEWQVIKRKMIFKEHLKTSTCNKQFRQFHRGAFQ